MVTPKDTAAEEIQGTDSTVIRSKTNLLPQPPRLSGDSTKPASDSLQIVFKTYSSEDAANLALKKYISFGHKVNLHKRDSSRYELYLNLPSAGTDTTKAIDSLRKFFGGNPYVRP